VGTAFFEEPQKTCSTPRRLVHRGKDDSRSPFPSGDPLQHPARAGRAPLRASWLVSPEPSPTSKASSYNSAYRSPLPPRRRLPGSTPEDLQQRQYPGPPSRSGRQHLSQSYTLYVLYDRATSGTIRSGRGYPLLDSMSPFDIVEDGLSAGEDVQLLLDVGDAVSDGLRTGENTGGLSRMLQRIWHQRLRYCVSASLGASGLRDDILHRT